jgi:hypothetical protein
MTLRSPGTRPSTFVSARALMAQAYGKICSLEIEITE